MTGRNACTPNLRCFWPVNVGLMPRYLPACIHTHKFNLVQRAVATRYRERWRRNIDSAFRLNCPFCDADLETLEHLHTMCTVSRSAATIILSRQLDKTNFLILKDAEADDFIFRTTSRSIPQAQLIILIVFSLATSQCPQHCSPRLSR